jgi:hypothetical protein
MTDTLHVTAWIPVGYGNYGGLLLERQHWFIRFYLYYFDGSNYDLIDELDNNGADNQWIHFTATITDPQYFVSNFRIRFDATLSSYRQVWVDDVVITKEVNNPNNYQLDLEVQFTNVIDFLSSNELCIYAGSLGAEDLHVSYWTGSVWQSLATDLTANSWNNFTVPVTSQHLPFDSWRLESGDPTPDQWQIDVTLLSSHGSEAGTLRWLMILKC